MAFQSVTPAIVETHTVLLAFQFTRKKSQRPLKSVLFLLATGTHILSELNFTYPFDYEERKKNYCCIIAHIKYTHAHRFVTMATSTIVG